MAAIFQRLTKEHGVGIRDGRIAFIGLVVWFECVAVGAVWKARNFDAVVMIFS